MKLTSLLLKNTTKSVSSDILKLRSASKLPRFLHEVTIGQLLSDAACTGSSPTSNSRLEWSFGTQRELYAKFIESFYLDYIGTGLTSRLVNTVRGGPKIFTSYRLKTLSLPVFNYYRSLFYQLDPNTNKIVKSIPFNITELLSPVVLAHLIMGDGNFQTDANSIRIFTNGFKQADLERLAKGIQDKYDITVRIRHDRKDQYILIIGPKDLVKCQDLVIQYFHPSMLYRIGL